MADRWRSGFVGLGYILPYWIPSHAAVKETAEPVVDGTKSNSGNERSHLGPKSELNIRSGRGLPKPLKSNSP